MDEECCWRGAAVRSLKEQDFEGLTRLKYQRSADFYISTIAFWHDPVLSADERAYYEGCRLAQRSEGAEFESHFQGARCRVLAAVIGVVYPREN